MGSLMLKCSVTGREFSTGIYNGEAKFRSLPNTVTKARCRHCGWVHSWWTRDTRWVDAVRPGEWAAAVERSLNERNAR
jgi:hypothetical protein